MYRMLRKRSFFYAFGLFYCLLHFSILFNDKHSEISTEIGIKLPTQILLYFQTILQSVCRPACFDVTPSHWFSMELINVAFDMLLCVFLSDNDSVLLGHLAGQTFFFDGNNSVFCRQIIAL